MANGYTYPVLRGDITSFRQFALLCSRAFMPLVRMRDQPLDAPLPEKVEPDIRYHEQRLLEIQAEVERLDTADLEAYAEELYQKELKDYEEYLRARAEENNRLRAMLKEVEAWEPPEVLLPVKEFMQEQLKRAIHEVSSPPPTKLSAAGLRESTLARLERDKEYHTRKIKEEVERAEWDTNWLNTLRSSLP